MSCIQGFPRFRNQRKQGSVSRGGQGTQPLIVVIEHGLDPRGGQGIQPMSVDTPCHLSPFVFEREGSIAFCNDKLWSVSHTQLRPLGLPHCTAPGLRFTRRELAITTLNKALRG